MRIGFDVDGTLTNERFEDIHKSVMNTDQSLELFVHKMIDFTPSYYMGLLQTHIHNHDEIFIITYRWDDWAEATKKWFEKYVKTEKIKFYFSTPDIRTNDVEVYKRNAVVYKSRAILENDLHYYYDDSDFLIEALTITCPRTKIIKATVHDKSIADCPHCGNEIIIQEYKNGICPRCFQKYLWDGIGEEWTFLTKP